MIVIKDKEEKLTKKLKKELAIRVIIATFLFVSLFVLFVFLIKRELQLLFIILFSITSITYLGYMMFVFTQYGFKVKSYLSLLKSLNHASKSASDVMVIGVEGKTTHYLNIEVVSYSAIDLSNNKKVFLYIDTFHPEYSLEINKEYRISSYRGFIVEFEEIKHDS